jgi:hypothetical protein
MVVLITFMVEKIMLKASGLGYIVVLKHYHDLKFTTKLCLCYRSLAFSIMYDHWYYMLKTKFLDCTILYLIPIWNVQGGFETIHMFHTLYVFPLVPFKNKKWVQVEKHMKLERKTWFVLNEVTNLWFIAHNHAITIDLGL